MYLPCVADFYVYFGTIAPDKIELKLTPENLLPGVEVDLTNAIAEGPRCQNFRFVFRQSICPSASELIYLIGMH